MQHLSRQSLGLGLARFIAFLRPGKVENRYSKEGVARKCQVSRLLRLPGSAGIQSWSSIASTLEATLNQRISTRGARLVGLLF